VEARGAEVLHIASKDQARCFRLPIRRH
jgi:hypothetical protein